MIVRPLTICQISPSDAGGGAELCAVSLHESLLNQGHNSHLFVARKVKDKAGVHEIPYVRGLPGLRRLARRIEKQTGLQDIYNPSFRNLRHLLPHDTDIIHFHNLWGAAGYADLGALPTLTRSIPGIFTEHQQWSFSGHCACHFDCTRWQTGCGKCPDLSIPPRIPRDATRWNWKRKKRLIQNSNLSFAGVSDYICSLARKSPIWSGKRIVRIYNGVDTTVFAPVGETRKCGLRKKHRISEETCAVLLTGKTIRGFHLPAMQEAFEAINRAPEHVYPVLVGDSAAEVAAKYIERPSCIIASRTDPQQMAECYQMCDITLLTPRTEAFGRVAAESQACGTPVVAFDCEGLAETVRNETSGISVPFGDLEQLVQALMQVSNDEKARRRMALSARRFALDNFDQRLITSQYLDLYCSCLDKNEDRPCSL